MDRFCEWSGPKGAAGRNAETLRNRLPTLQGDSLVMAKSPQYGSNGGKLPAACGVCPVGQSFVLDRPAECAEEGFARASRVALRQLPAAGNGRSQVSGNRNQTNALPR